MFGTIQLNIASRDVLQVISQDADVIAKCKTAGLILRDVIACNDGRLTLSDAEMSGLQSTAWKLTRAAMQQSINTPAGACAQLVLLLAHYESGNGNCDHPGIELAPIKAALRIFSAAA